MATMQAAKEATEELRRAVGASYDVSSLALAAPLGPDDDAYVCVELTLADVAACRAWLAPASPGAWSRVVWLGARGFEVTMATLPGLVPMQVWMPLEAVREDLDLAPPAPSDPLPLPGEGASAERVERYRAAKQRVLQASQMAAAAERSGSPVAIREANAELRNARSELVSMVFLLDPVPPNPPGREPSSADRLPPAPPTDEPDRCASCDAGVGDGHTCAAPDSLDEQGAEPPGKPASHGGVSLSEVPEDRQATALMETPAPSVHHPSD